MKKAIKEGMNARSKKLSFKFIVGIFLSSFYRKLKNLELVCKEDLKTKALIGEDEGQKNVHSAYLDRFILYFETCEFRRSKVTLLYS